MVYLTLTIIHNSRGLVHGKIAINIRVSSSTHRIDCSQDPGGTVVPALISQQIVETEDKMSSLSTLRACSFLPPKTWRLGQSLNPNLYSRRNANVAQTNKQALLQAAKGQQSLLLPTPNRVKIHQGHR
jgi:hypothetical protein